MSSVLEDYRQQGVADGRRYPIDSPSARSQVRRLCGLDAANSYQEGFDQGRNEKVNAFTHSRPDLLRAFTNTSHWAELALDGRPKVSFGVTEIAHPALLGVSGDCGECLALTDEAVNTARATGSRGATYSSGEHSVTVRRLVAVVEV